MSVNQQSVIILTFEKLKEIEIENKSWCATVQTEWISDPDERANRFNLFPDKSQILRANRFNFFPDKSH